MQCERLLKLTKSWYLSVKDETMAPARMISFMKNHVATCDVCQADPDLQEEILKITEIVVPEAKLPKTTSQQDPDDVDDEENGEDDENDNIEDGDIDDDEDISEDDDEDEEDLDLDEED